MVSYVNIVNIVNMSKKQVNCEKCGSEVYMDTEWAGLTPPKPSDYCPTCSPLKSLDILSKKVEESLGFERTPNTLQAWESLTTKAKAESQAEYDYWYNKKKAELEGQDHNL